MAAEQKQEANNKKKAGRLFHLPVRLTSWPRPPSHPFFDFPDQNWAILKAKPCTVIQPLYATGP